MTDAESQLWNSIKNFRFDEPTAVLTFSKRLARENGLEPRLAEQIVEEYRRFIFLCCVSPGQISPSFLVDQAWHLHLTYTRSYWVDLCQNTIERDLHHNPTQGGAAEDQKFKGLYQDTRALYRQYFGTEPPPNIWPANDKDPRKSVVEVDTSANWVIAKPRITRHKLSKSLAVSAIALLTLSAGCTAVGPVSVGLVIAGAIGVFFVMFSRSNKKRRNGSSGCGSGIIGINDYDDSGDSYDADCDTADSSDCSDSSSDSGGDSGSGCSSGCSGGCGGGGGD